MKGRESGMPEPDYWATFFDAEGILRVLECAPTGQESVIEFGSGYGTFTLPVAKSTTGKVYALDIESDLVAALQKEARRQALSNLIVQERDFVSEGTGLPDNSIDHVLLYNILHIEDPVALLKEVYRVLRPQGSASIIHWQHDEKTPRGPSMTIRPRAQQCAHWAEFAGFRCIEQRDISPFAPYHYGLILSK